VKKMSDDKSLVRLMKLLRGADQPFNEDAVSMDCKDGCEELAQLAERVIQGEKIEEIFPVYADHMDQIGCCKEEFDALVNVLKVDKEDPASPA